MSEDTVEAAFGRRVREARNARGWSQGRLAETIALDPSSVSRLESGRQRLSLTQAVQVASALGVSLDTLLTPTTPGAELGAALAALDDAVVVAREALTATLTAALRVDIAGRRVTADELQAAAGETDSEEVLPRLAQRVGQVAAATGSVVTVTDESVADRLSPLVWSVAERIVATEG